MESSFGTICARDSGSVGSSIISVASPSRRNHSHNASKAFRHEIFSLIISDFVGDHCDFTANAIRTRKDPLQFSQSHVHFLVAPQQPQSSIAHWSSAYAVVSRSLHHIQLLLEQLLGCMHLILMTKSGSNPFRWTPELLRFLSTTPMQTVT